jgi:hypothetical protein
VPTIHVLLVSASCGHLLRNSRIELKEHPAGQSVVDATLGEPSAAEPLVSSVVEQILGRAPAPSPSGEAQHRGFQVNHPG